MGYMGLGMQSWITKMKPREFLGKRSKPDGGGVEKRNSGDIRPYYYLKKRSLKNLALKKYNSRYKEKLTSELKHENRKRNLFLFLSVLFFLVLLLIFASYINQNFNLR